MDNSKTIKTIRAILIESIDWTPSITGHNCLRVNIDQYWDENLDNNMGQENTDVSPASSPAKVYFTLHNPMQTAELIYLETMLIDGRDLWSATINREYPQVLGPDEEYEVLLLVEVPDDIDNGTTCVYVVNAYIDGTLIGGIEVDVVKMVNKSETTTGGFSIPFSTILSSIIIVPALVVLLKKRRKRFRNS